MASRHNSPRRGVEPAGVDVDLHRRIECVLLGPYFLR